MQHFNNRCFVFANRNNDKRHVLYLIIQNFVFNICSEYSISEIYVLITLYFYFFTTANCKVHSQLLSKFYWSNWSKLLLSAITPIPMYHSRVFRWSSSSSASFVTSVRSFVCRRSRLALKSARRSRSTRRKHTVLFYIIVSGRLRA